MLNKLLIVKLNRMKKLLEIFDAFQLSLESLDSEVKIVIGGTAALVLHGLDLGREIEDLDVIIYKPNLSIISTCNIIATLDAMSMADSEYNTKTRRSFKLKKGDCTLNIILETGVDRPVSSEWLRFRGFYVQTVKEVINAKKSYHRDYGNYRRVKDVIDFQNLKNLNFNF